MENKNIITKEGLAELKAEMKNLIEVERPKVIEDIADARAQGDLSENAEFDAAREKQGQIEDRIREIEAIIENSKVSSSSSKSDKVRIGSKVKIVYLDNKVEEEYTIVGTLEVDPFKSLISNVSPLGKALMGKTKGDEVSFTLSDKNSKRVDIKIKKVDNK